MTIAKNRAEVLALARAELGALSGDGAIVARGGGLVRGVPVRWTRTCRASGPCADVFEGALAHAAGFDGRHGWQIDESGMPGPLDLGDLEELIVSIAAWSGQWARGAGGVTVDETVTAESGRLVLGLRAASGALRFRLAVDAATALPRTLELAGRDDLSITFDDFRPTPAGRVPHRITMRQAWLVDTLEVSSIETVAGDVCGPTDAVLARGVPDDVRWGPVDAPIDTRFTRNHLPLVRPRIDGRKVGWFLVDTGAGAHGVDSEVAAALGLPELGRRFVRTSDGVTGAPYRRARTLTIGAATIDAPLFLELDLAPFARAAGVALAGVLGYDLFMRAVVGIDRNTGVTVAPAANDEVHADWLPLRFEEGAPMIPARFVGPAGDRCGLFAIDTGSAVGVTASAAAAAGFVLRGGARVGMRGLTGAVGARARQLPWLELGGHRCEDVAVLVARAGPGAFGHGEAGAVVGSLGMSLLHDFAITFDYPRRRARLQRRMRTGPRARQG